MIEKFGGRKFIFAIVVTVIFSILVLVGKMTVEQFTGSIQWIYGLFAGANAVAKVAPYLTEEAPKK